MVLSSNQFIQIETSLGTPKGITPEYPMNPTVLGLGLGLTLGLGLQIRARV